jgi:lipoyl(octanoyl) transferase
VTPVVTSPAPQPEFQWLGRIAYQEALELQSQLSEQRRLGQISDTILLLEHDPVYTIGRTRDRSSLRGKSPLPHPVIEINRGGQATYHGPGQLVGYPILDLTGFGRDLHRYLRALELALIAACSAHGIKAALRDGLTGVWVEERKIASIGVGVRRWITMHGFAINVRNNLAGFDNIIPCGLENVSMTSLEQETGSTMSVAAFANELRPCLLAELESLRSPAP